ncbi:MAG: hypothetical protein ACRENE_03575, partial [Polyangiaceae bacterium]
MKGTSASTVALLGMAMAALGCGSAKSARFSSPSTDPGSSPSTTDDGGGALDATTLTPVGDGGSFAIGPRTEADGGTTQI